MNSSTGLPKLRKKLSSRIHCRTKLSSKRLRSRHLKTTWAQTHLTHFQRELLTIWKVPQRRKDLLWLQGNLSQNWAAHKRTLRHQLRHSWQPNCPSGLWSKLRGPYPHWPSRNHKNPNWKPAQRHWENYQGNGDQVLQGRKDHNSVCHSCKCWHDYSRGFITRSATWSKWSLNNWSHY